MRGHSGRFQLSLLPVFALAALATACVGIYGVVAQSLARRDRGPHGAGREPAHDPVAALLAGVAALASWIPRAASQSRRSRSASCGH
jgi:hypothetical protein